MIITNGTTHVTSASLRLNESATAPIM